MALINNLVACRLLTDVCFEVFLSQLVICRVWLPSVRVNVDIDDCVSALRSNLVLSLRSRVTLTGWLRSIQLPDNLCLLWIQMVKLHLILMWVLLVCTNLWILVITHILHLLLLVLRSLKRISLRNSHYFTRVIEILWVLTFPLALISYGSRIEEMLRERTSQIHLGLYLGRLLKVRLLPSRILVILIHLDTAGLLVELDGLFGCRRSWGCSSILNLIANPNFSFDLLFLQGFYIEVKCLFDLVRGRGWAVILRNEIMVALLGLRVLLWTCHTVHTSSVLRRRSRCITHENHLLGVIQEPWIKMSTENVFPLLKVYLFNLFLGSSTPIRELSGVQLAIFYTDLVTCMGFRLLLVF